MIKLLKNTKSTSLSFGGRVYKATREIPKGRVATYKSIAKAIGMPGSARAVGNALNKNPYAPKVPCHRVIRSGGFVGGFASGTKNKIKILGKEGVKIKNHRINLKKFGYEF